MDRAQNILQFRHRVDMHGTKTGPNADLDYAESYHPGNGGSDDYRGMHTAPEREEGYKNSLDDMSDVFPGDIYNPAVAWRYYGHGGDSVHLDKQSAEIIARFVGQPDAWVTIYRAVPSDVDQINRGDWVTINPNYAHEHGWRHVGDDYHVISLEVRARDIVTDGNSIHEFGYDPVRDMRPRGYL